MKKILLLTIWAASVSVQALPTYEPFSEFAGNIASNPTNLVAYAANGTTPEGTNAIGSITNCIDLATGGYTAPGGEAWSSLNFSGSVGTGLHGVDVAVISNATIFTAANLSALLPAGFPGNPASGGITYLAENPAQPIIWGTTNYGASANIVGNSAVLRFSQDFTRPTNGIKTLFYSYLFTLVQQGQLGGGNEGRYLSFVASSNLVEGPGTGGAYTNWLNLFNVFSTAATNTVHYFGNGVLQDGSSFYIGPCDSSAGKDFSTSPFVGSYGTPLFVVGAYIMNATNGVKDTNIVWVNPATTALGGAAPASTLTSAINTMAFNMSDIGGLVLEDRIGSGAAGGLGTNYIANLILGSTWSYVTGGPEFTNQPVAINGNFGNTYTFSANAVAAGQSVTYQWQKVSGGTTNNLTDGSGTAGGSAAVSGSQSANLTLAGISAGDLGSYQVVATASGTGYSLTSSSATLIVDPFVTSEPAPQATVVNYGGQASFTASASTSRPSISYNWLLNGTPLSNGAQTDGSFISGASGTVSSGTLNSTLTISNVTYLEAGNYTLYVTNNFNNATVSAAATLAVNDPTIVAQPTNAAVVAGQNATFTVTASGSPTLNYQWYVNGNALNDGPTGTGSTISGSRTSTLTISSVSDADANAGGYYVTISGSNSGQSTNSATVTLGVADPLAIVSQPVSRTERAGDHLAFVVGATGGLLNYQWQLNGTNIPGATANVLILTNIQPANSGTYTVQVSNLAGSSSASATLNVINSTLLPLASTNIIVARIGDGAQALSGSGNTIYLDQYTTNGVYVSTIQVPDEGVGQPYGTGSSASVFGSPALLAQGAGSDAPNSLFLTLSAGNEQYLNFAAYCQQYPYSGSDVTTGAAGNWRGLASINAFGLYSLVYTNTGLYNGGNHTIRGTVTLDDTNFWTTGQAGANGIKFANTTVASYANGSGVPVITSGAASTKVVQIFNGNLVFSDSAGASGAGIYACSGTPEPVPVGTASSALLLNEGGQPNDFAVSPDGQTVYIADGQQFGGTNIVAGGIQRWDTNVGGGGWTYAYTFDPVNGATNGAQGLTVYFPTNVTTWGPGVTGAVLYATSYGATTNSLSQIVDNGPASTATVIATAGPNQALRGVRFGPAAIPVFILSGPQSQTNFPNNSVTFKVNAGGSQPIYYQWQFNGANIAGATQSTFTTNSISMASAGNYSVIVSNLVPSSVASSNAVLTVTAGAPVFSVDVPSYIEGAGDHLAFAPVVSGSTPLSAQWYFNDVNHPLAGETNLTLVLTDIQTSQSGTYLLYVTNIYGSVHGSGSLTVTPSPVALSSNNLVVVRTGDGVQALSGVTGNTLYLDQYTPNGTYVGSIQIPDEGTGLPYGTGGSNSASMPFGSPALLVAGNNTPSLDAAFEGLLTLSADSQTLNFAGYCEPYPFAGPDLSVGANGGLNWRGIGSVNAFGYYSLVYTNTGLYSGGAHVIHSAVTLDQTNYWTTGEAGLPGVKYVTPSFEPANGSGIPALGGSDAGTRHIQIIGGSIYFSDMNSPAGIYYFGGTPETPATPTLLVTETNSPMDFAISPDNQTVYIADNGIFGGTNVQAGGIQRWDADPVNGGYAFSYTLGTGSGSVAGARGLTVDFSAQTTWGAGATGAKLYASTAESSGNRLIKIVDVGASSAATTLATGGANNILSGVRFGPVAVPVNIAAEPQNTTAVVGTGASFSVTATGSQPYFYQWQFNGTNLPGATQSSLTVDAAQAALSGSYTVVVSNLMPSSATSTPASVTMTPVLGFNGSGSGWATNGTSGAGLPNFNYNGNSNMVELTQGVANQASSTFYESPVYVGGFLATWTYQVINPSGTVADGTCFVVQNDPRGTAAIGSAGGAFGYGSTGAITNSVALEMNIYTNASGGDGIALDTNGNIGPNLSVSPILLGSGDPINVTVQYLNGVATVTLFDTVTSNSFTANSPINVPAVVGGNKAYVGFTAGDGAAFSTQTISNFVFTSLLTLSATNAGGNSLAFNWPLGAGGYVLQQNSSLTTTNWVNSSVPVNIVNGQNQVVIPVGSGQTFYRLVLPQP